MNDKIKKIDSTKTPKQARSYGGPATAGVEYDNGRNTLIITPDSNVVKNPLRHSFPDQWSESTVLQGATPATAANYDVFWTAPYGVTVTGIVIRFGTASASGTVDVRKAASGTAFASGTSLLSAPASTAGTINTNLTATLTGTAANLNLNAGDSLGLVSGGTLTSLANLSITILMRRTPDVA